MIEDIHRIKYETNKYLLEHNGSELQLFRRLSGFQLNQILSDSLNCYEDCLLEINSNYITSFHTEHCNPGLIEIKYKCSIEEILFWENLLPFNGDSYISGLALEHEALLTLSKNKIIGKISQIDVKSIEQRFLENGRK